MKFRYFTPADLDGQLPSVNLTGSTEKIVYKFLAPKSKDPNGKLVNNTDHYVVVPVSDGDINDYIKQFAVDCDIYNIIAKIQHGIPTNAFLDDGDLSFGVPLADNTAPDVVVHNKVKDSLNTFNNLPDEIKALYDKGLSSDEILTILSSKGKSMPETKTAPNSGDLGPNSKDPNKTETDSVKQSTAVNEKVS